MRPARQRRAILGMGARGVNRREGSGSPPGLPRACGARRLGLILAAASPPCGQAPLVHPVKETPPMPGSPSAASLAARRVLILALLGAAALAGANARASDVYDGAV